MRKNSGFTVIELMIVVALVGILAALISGAMRRKTVSTCENPKRIEKILKADYKGTTVELENGRLLGLYWQESVQPGDFVCADGKIKQGQ